MRNKDSNKSKWKRLRPWVRILIVLLILAALTFLGKTVYGIFNSGNHNFFEGSTYSESCDRQVDEAVEGVIVDFTNKLYQAQNDLPGPYSYLEYDQGKIDSYIPNMTEFFKNPDGINAKCWQQSLRYLVTARAISPMDLKADNIGFDLEYLDVTTSKNECTVSYFESAHLEFAFLDGIVSESYNMPCEITLAKVDDEWKVVSYRRDDDFSGAYGYVYEKLIASGSSKSKAIDKSFNELIKRYKKTLKARQKQKDDFLNGLVSYEDIHVDVKYDREKAKEYGAKYIKTRNSEEWDVYDDLGGNCQNFGSQVLYTGGIPMDTVGGAYWKYYNSAVDYTSAKVGRSPSWTSAPHFRAYAKANTGFGLVATVDANLYSAEPGDILQVGGKKGEVSHTNVVIEAHNPDDIETFDILYNSNTNNRINWPLSASLSGFYSLIKVHGYNK